MSDEEDKRSKPAIVARPVDRDEEEEESDRPSTAKAAKPVDDDERDKDRDVRRDREHRDDRYYGPPGHGQPYPPPYPPRPSFFSAENFNKLVSLALLIGIICLLIGTMCTVGARLTKIDYGDDADDREAAEDQQRNLYGASVLLDGIGLFIIALFLFLLLMSSRDLTEKQVIVLIILMAAVIIGFTLLAR